MNERRAPLRAGELCVVKIGSAVLTADGQGLDLDAMSGWVADIVALRGRSIRCAVVSSGAVAEGLRRLGQNRRPTKLHQLQAAAAMGQMGLVQAWESCFSTHGLHTAQVLLTHEDLADRTRYLNARTTLRSLLDAGAVPIVNENDAVAAKELRFGDNDTLAGLVANLLEARLLLILTDREGLLSADPSIEPGAELIAQAPVADERLDRAAGGGDSRLGRGGMHTKLAAARLAARSATDTVIADGRQRGVIGQVAVGEPRGTWLRAGGETLVARKRWLAGGLRAKGSLTLDAGAVRVLRQSGSSLLAVGVLGVAGAFKRGDLVRCLDEAGQEVARGLVNYDADEAGQIAGKPTGRIVEILGYVTEDELIHRDNLVIM